MQKYTKSNYSNILAGSQLNFGTCQKLLNLYLKYLWCLGEIETPPHFPVDGIIQDKLQIKNEIRISWTRLEDENPYMQVIEKARELQRAGNYNSLAEMELELWNEKYAAG